MADALTPEQQRSMVAAHLPTLTKAAGGCYLGKYDLHQLTSVELQRLLDNAAAVSAADNRALTEERDALRERVEALEKVQLFAGKVLGYHREHMSDVDGGDIQEWALAAGLLHEVAVTESCGAEDCACLDYYGEISEQFPAQCMRLTDAGRSAIDAAVDAAMTRDPKAPTDP